ncbi:hypothetical protein AGENTSMITH_156 [Bacillus phage vB_BspM_AgentSmith]|nr:hypothetical protein AGENTSMITH_156 [Bacillus phage vB_BspM_AgentSmith]
MKLKVILEQRTTLNSNVENAVSSKEYILKELKGSKKFRLEETLISSTPEEYKDVFKPKDQVIAITDLTYTDSSSPEEGPQCGMKYINEVLASIKKYNSIKLLRPTPLF